MLKVKVVNGAPIPTRPFFALRKWRVDALGILPASGVDGYHSGCEFENFKEVSDEDRGATLDLVAALKRHEKGRSEV